MAGCVRNDSEIRSVLGSDTYQYQRSIGISCLPDTSPTLKVPRDEYQAQKSKPLQLVIQADPIGRLGVWLTLTTNMVQKA